METNNGDPVMSDARYMRPGLPFAMSKAIEEAGEFLSAIGKAQRWGWLSVNPELPKPQQETNLAWVRREMTDVRGAIDNLEREINKAEAAGWFGNLTLSAGEHRE